MTKEHKYGKPHKHISNSEKRAVENKYNQHAIIYEGAAIGNNCWIGAFTFIDDGVVIQDECSLSLGAQLLSHDTSYYHATEGKVPPTTRKTIVEHHCQIGAGAIVLPGVTIGHNSIVGAGAVVTKSVPPFSVAVGNPAKVIKKVDAEIGDK